ncbi:MAG: hypothetical protein ACRD0G_08765 [Acidimicrobiales bacterium]
MSRSLLERRLTEVAGRLRELRRELVLTDEQLLFLSDQADEMRVRALVAETPIAEQELREAQRHADAMLRHRAGVQTSIERLERTQDELLDRLSAQR